MSFFDDLQDDVRRLVVFLPVRVGLWMARQDDDVTSVRDERREIKAITSAIEEIGKVKTAPFIQEWASLCLAGRAHWQTDAEQDEDNMMTDLKTALREVDTHLSAVAGRQYRSALWRVAQATAMAYGEEKAENASENMVANSIRRLFERLDDGTPDDPTHISPREREALKKLKSALQVS